MCVKTGADFELHEFKVFCPKALAGIGKLPDTLEDRSISIELRRKRPAEKLKIQEEAGCDSIQTTPRKSREVVSV